MWHVTGSGPHPQTPNPYSALMWDVGLLCDLCSCLTPLTNNSLPLKVTLWWQGVKQPPVELSGLSCVLLPPQFTFHSLLMLNTVLWGTFHTSVHQKVVFAWWAGDWKQFCLYDVCFCRRTACSAALSNNRCRQNEPFSLKLFIPDHQNLFSDQDGDQLVSGCGLIKPINRVFIVYWVICARQMTLFLPYFALQGLNRHSITNML